MSDTIPKQAARSIFTSTNKSASINLRGWILVPCLTFFLVSCVFADSSKDKTAFLTKAREALKVGSKKRADFYATRYLTFCGTASKDGCSEAALQAFLKERQLAPQGFIRADWDPGFLDWFERASRELWNIEDNRVRERFRSFEVARSLYEEKYFVTIAAYPELELWHVTKNVTISKPLLLTMGSYRDRPILFFGKILKGQTSFQGNSLFLNTQKRTLHYVWKPEFVDLDQDHEPEVWVRYNIAWGNGFSQILEVYKIKDERELVLLKRFQGAPDGIARRLPDGRVEVASRLSTPGAGISAMDDKHHLETWEYSAGEFKKVSEKDIPFILDTPQWAEYYQ